MSPTIDRRTILRSAAIFAGTAVVAEAGLAATSGGGDIIDVHAHAVLPAWLRALEAVTKSPPGGGTMAGMKLPAWSPETHVGYMDREGIAAGVLSWPDGASMLRGRPARDLARAMNESWAEIVAKHPKRFGAFATVPLDDIDAVNEEMAYALDVLKLDGVACTCQLDGAYLGDPRYDPWFAELNRRKAVLFVHPGVPKGLAEVYVGPNVSTLEFMFESTRMVTKMVMTGAKARYPDIEMISTHGGGTIPYLAHRIAISIGSFGAGAGRPPMSQNEVLSGLASFHYDLTASTSAAQLDAMLRLVPTARLMMGFDYPMMPEPLTAPEIKAFDAYPDLGPADRAAIRSGNALRLFPKLAARRKA